MSSVLDTPFARAALRTAGDDPNRRAAALEMIVVQHEHTETLRAEVRYLEMWSIGLRAAAVAGFGVALWALRRR